MGMSPFKLVCAMGFFAIFSSTISKSPVLPLFADNLGAPASQIGLVAAASTIAGILFSIPAGLLSDRFGRKSMLMASGVVFASAPAMYLITTHIWQLAVVRFYHGLATAIFIPVAMAYVSDQHENTMGEKLGWFSTATLCGRFLAPLSGGALLGLVGSNGSQTFHGVYLVCLIAGVVALALSFRVQPQKVAQKVKGNRHAQFDALKQLASSRRLLTIGAVEAAVLFMYGTIEIFLPLYALKQNLSTVQIGMFLSAQIITLALTKPAMGKFSDQHERTPQIICGSALGIVAVLSLVFCTGFLSLLIVSILIGLSLSAVTSATAAAVAEISRCENRGSAMGIFGTIMDVGHSAGPLASGILVASFGFKASFIAAALVIGLAMTVFIITEAFEKTTCPTDQHHTGETP
jgi:DHA1 family multidrug resistance protein-like MFS transporter